MIFHEHVFPFLSSKEEFAKETPIPLPIFEDDNSIMSTMPSTSSNGLLDDFLRTIIDSLHQEQLSDSQSPIDPPLDGLPISRSTRVKRQ